MSVKPINWEYQNKDRAYQPWTNKNKKCQYKNLINFIALKTRSVLIMSVSNDLIPENWGSNSWVTEIGLVWLDFLIFTVPFTIQNKYVKPSWFKSFTKP